MQPCVFTHAAVDKTCNKSPIDLLNGDCFETIRSRQPYSHNLLTLCMIIDNPDVFREVVRTCRAYPTHDNADDVLA